MKKKIIIIVSLLLLVLILGITYYKLNNNYKGIYQIKIEKIDEKSPDRHLIVLKNGKETKKYSYIKFNDKSDIIVCKLNNPTVNIYDIDVDDLIIVFPNNSETVAKIIKEEK